MFLPVVTLHTFEDCNDTIQEAVALVMYKNVKASELYNDVNGLISEKQSINALRVDNIIGNKVNHKIKNMSDKCTSIQCANGKAIRNLKRIQEATINFQNISDTSSASYSTNAKSSISTFSSLKGRPNIKSRIYKAPPLVSIPTDILDLTSTPSTGRKKVSFVDLTSKL